MAISLCWFCVLPVCVLLTIVAQKMFWCSLRAKSNPPRQKNGSFNSGASTQRTPRRARVVAVQVAHAPVPRKMSQHYLVFVFFRRISKPKDQKCWVSGIPVAGQCTKAMTAAPKCDCTLPGSGSGVVSSIDLPFTKSRCLRNQELGIPNPMVRLPFGACHKPIWDSKCP